MQHYHAIEEAQLQNAWVTIGTFDGVHRGHQAIVRSLVSGAHAAGSPAVVITFHPHPAILFSGRQAPFYLTDPEERAQLLGELGVDAVITHPFTREVAGTSAADFMALLSRHLGLRHLWAGYDFALGKGREGTVPVLRQLGETLGYTVDQMPPVQDEGEIISSSQIRSLLTSGKVEQAAELLGRPYQVPGVVVQGEQRGRTLGIPTANLEVWAERILPQAGVYAGHVLVDSQPHLAVTNVGVNPTFENQLVAPRVEAHILDFERDLYGQTIRVGFEAYLRPEERYPNVRALLDQIQEDIRIARTLFPPKVSQ